MTTRSRQNATRCLLPRSSLVCLVLLAAVASCSDEKLPPLQVAPVTAEPPTASSAAPPAAHVEVLYASDFETGPDLRDKGHYDRRWTTNQTDASLTVEAPRGEGNVSAKALTYCTRKVRRLASCEVPLRRLVVEPQGCDGRISFRFYNGGFRNVYVMYLTLFPSDANNYRCYFDAPKGEWVTCDFPLDRFLYLDARPRRGPTNPLEAIVFVAHDPESPDAVFQLDDVKLYRVKQAHPVVAKEKPPLPEGVLYRQDFDDPDDFDLESFYAFTYDCRVTRVAHDPATTGRPATEGGCLRIEGVKSGKQVKAGRSTRFGGDAVIEFDLLARGVRKFALVGRCLSRKDLWLDPGAPDEGRWKHYRVRAADFHAAGLLDAPGPREGEGAGETFWSLMFRFFADDREGPHEILVDNLIVRIGGPPAAE